MDLLVGKGCWESVTVFCPGPGTGEAVRTAPQGYIYCGSIGSGSWRTQR